MLMSDQRHFKPQAGSEHVCIFQVKNSGPPTGIYLRVDNGNLHQLNGGNFLNGIYDKWFNLKVVVDTARGDGQGLHRQLPEADGEHASRQRHLVLQEPHVHLRLDHLQGLLQEHPHPQEVSRRRRACTGSPALI
jgi:hypothetical protein